jgi:hypothetical protein
MIPEYFLSASIPDPRRDPKYFDTSDMVTIRDAVLALTTVVLPRGRLVFGGHPAITPMVREVAEFMDQGSFLRRVIIYQSAYFERHMPSDNQSFENVVITRSAGAKEASLLVMRKRMFREHHFAAAFFIGGMDGVEKEYDLLMRMQPRVKCFPIASTGAAAAIVYNSVLPTLPRKTAFELKTDFSYMPLFRRLIQRAHPTE